MINYLYIFIISGSKGNSLASDDGTDYICVRAHFASMTTDNSINSLKLIGKITLLMSSGYL